MIYITSDQHWGHVGIVGRKFDDLAHMNNHMVQAWNERVLPADTVYHLGDIFWNLETARAVLPRLNGNIKLIKGNHDYWLKYITRSEGDIWSKIELLPPIHRLNFNKTAIILCHFPLRTWYKVFRGSIHLFGHVHAALNDDRLPRSLDVGVDSVGFKPLSIEEIWTRLMKDEILPEEVRVSGGLSNTK